MSGKKACYRKLSNYKYQLMHDYKVEVELTPAKDIKMPFITLTTDGELIIHERYAWDGPSGPTIDTCTFMRAALVHDALYQLMRQSRLDLDTREYVDNLLKQMCRQDGMFCFRAWYVHKFVRIFGESHARPSPAPQDDLICVP